MKRELPLLITAVMGVFLILQAFIPHPPINTLDQILNDFALIVIVFTMILGLLSLFYSNIRKAARRQAGWGYAAVTVLAFAATVFAGLFNPGEDRALAGRLLADNSRLVRTIAEDAARRDGLPEETADLAAALIAKTRNPDLALEESFFARHRADPADVESLVRRGRIREEPFARLFATSGVDRQRFDRLAAKTEAEADRLVRGVLPAARAVEDYATNLLDLLADNGVFAAALAEAVNVPDGVDPRSLLPAAREAAAPLLSGRVELFGEPIDLEGAGEIVLPALVERGVKNARAAVEAARINDPDAALTPVEAVRAFASRNAAEGLFSPLEGEMSLLGRAVAELALRHVERGEMAPAAFAAAVNSLFGAGGLEPAFHLPSLEKGSSFQWIFDNVYSPLSSTMFALLAFFIASAAYRAFRAHSPEALLLLLAGFVVMLGQIPLGDTLTAWLPEWLQMSDIADWIMIYPNMASQRAIMIGVALGVISTALKIILGLERGYLGGD
ncbi:MAG: hypothetical protein C4523_09895 [Myxococcales bacterium]|nr:MAG: hypothetical protein C4523_09895 [Myxococcales bacterium]